MMTGIIGEAVKGVELVEKVRTYAFPALADSWGRGNTPSVPLPSKRSPILPKSLRAEPRPRLPRQAAPAPAGAQRSGWQG